MGRCWWFSEDGEFVERECLLFEAGAYPDKGVIVTADDLRAIVVNSDEVIPVKIEHLAESPFDGVLGVVTRLRAEGARLWGTLRQPVEAWRLAQRAGAKALSVGLDVAGRRLVETSFVCHPRVATAQVFAEGSVTQRRKDAKEDSHRDTETRREKGKESREGEVMRVTVVDDFYPEREEGEKMTSVRQFAEGLMGYLRGVTGGEELPHPQPLSEAERGELDTFAAERAALARERAALLTERAAQQILEWKRAGRLRAAERVEALARTLLTQGAGSVVMFDGASVPLSVMFAQFVSENGPVVPLGELLGADRYADANPGSDASGRLAALADAKAKADGLNYLQSLAAVTAANPELARAARGE